MDIFHGYGLSLLVWLQVRLMKVFGIISSFIVDLLLQMTLLERIIAVSTFGRYVIGIVEIQLLAVFFRVLQVGYIIPYLVHVDIHVIQIRVYPLI